jgi:hypothetical protein
MDVYYLDYLAHFRLAARHKGTRQMPETFGFALQFLVYTPKRSNRGLTEYPNIQNNS